MGIDPETKVGKAGALFAVRESSPKWSDVGTFFRLQKNCLTPHAGSRAAGDCFISVPHRVLRTPVDVAAVLAIWQREREGASVVRGTPVSGQKLSHSRLIAGGLVYRAVRALKNKRVETFTKPVLSRVAIRGRMEREIRGGSVS